MLLLEQEAKGEGDGTSQATIGNNELVLRGQLNNAELVDDESQTNHTWEGEHKERPVLGLGLFAAL